MLLTRYKKVTKSIRGISSAMPLIIFALFFLGATQPVIGQSFGKITGKVLYKGGQVKKIKNVIKDEHTCGTHDIIDESLLTAADGGIQWAVVSIISPIKNGKDLSTLASEKLLDQRECVFNPHVVLVGVNQTLKIKNSDHTLHNVRTTSYLNEIFSKAQIYIPGSHAPSDEVVFTEPEVIESVCDVHGWMKAYIHVVDNPYNVVTNESGVFELDEVPAGTYKLKVWQETLGEQEVEVKVTAGQETKINITYKK